VAARTTRELGKVDEGKEEPTRREEEDGGRKDDMELDAADEKPGDAKEVGKYGGGAKGGEGMGLGPGVRRSRCVLLSFCFLGGSACAPVYLGTFRAGGVAIAKYGALRS